MVRISVRWASERSRPLPCELEGNGPLLPRRYADDPGSFLCRRSQRAARRHHLAPFPTIGESTRVQQRRGVPEGSAGASADAA